MRGNAISRAHPAEARDMRSDLDAPAPPPLGRVVHRIAGGSSKAAIALDATTPVQRRHTALEASRRAHSWPLDGRQPASDCVCQPVDVLLLDYLDGGIDDGPGALPELLLVEPLGHPRHAMEERVQ